MSAGSIWGDWQTSVFTFPMIAGFLAICWTDLLQRRIPNRILLLLFLCLLIKWGFQQDLKMILISLLLGGAVFTLSFPFYLRRKLGAGDVKLLVLSCLIVGGVQAAEFSLWLAVIGIGICLMVYWPLPRLVWISGVHLVGRPDLETCYPSKNSIPYGIPISLATMICLLSVMWG